MTNKTPHKKPAFISHKELSAIAERVLEDHDIKSASPIDIERLCDLLNIRILIVPDLQKSFSVDAYINDTCSIIVVDAYVYSYREARARFSIAHELSHHILHKDFLSQFKIDSVEDYLVFQDSIGDEERKTVEIQAYILAGYLLMPTSLLRPAVTEVLGDATAAQIDINQLGQVIEALESAFQVSSLALAKQLAREFPEFAAIIKPLLDQPT